MKTASRGDWFADKVTRRIGSVASVVFHTVLFVGFFASAACGLWSFDTMLLALTTAVSLEAIYLCVFMQNSINRSGDRNRHRAEIDLSTNVAAKKEIEELQQTFVRMEKMMKHLISTRENSIDW